MSNSTLQRRIADLERQLAAAKKQARTKRDPLPGPAGRLQHLREAAGLSIQEIGRRSKLGAGVVSRLETIPDFNPTWKTLQSLAKGLKLPLQKLVLELISTP